MGSVIVEHQVSGRMWQRAMLNINHTTDGNIAYQNYWNTTPDLLLQHSLQVKPYSDVELVLRTQYISERVWAEFERLDGELNRNFHIQFPHRFSEFTNRLPSHINIDLTLSKWFWQQRLRAAVQLKNILNRAWQTHPIGIREGFGYLARVEFRF